MVRQHKSKAVSAKSSKTTFTKQDAKRLPKFSLFFFDRPRFTAVLFLAILAFGILSYTTLLKREGFPSFNFPIASINGTYIGEAAEVDAKVALPISKEAMKQEGVSSIQTQSFDNFFSVFVQYDENVDAQVAAKELEAKIDDQNIIPDEALVTVSAPYFSPAGIQFEKVDIGVSFYAQEDQTISDTVIAATRFSEELNNKNLETVKDVFVVNPFEQATNRSTGETQTIQRSFDRFGSRSVQDTQNEKSTFYQSTLIGVTMADGADLLVFDEEVRSAVAQLTTKEEFSDFGAVVSASYAPDIKDNISELQRELIIALVAVLIVGAIVIAFRASIITVMALIIIIFSVIGLLYLIGYTLNVITLFALILSLALIVDDTIIMVEAIDAQRRTQKDARKTISEATRKISRAMLSATFVAVLSFAPLLFVGGILGSFIRAIPATVIAALIISLLVSLTFIPFIAKYILLRKENMGEEGVKEVAAGFEKRLAGFIARPMQWAKGSLKRLTAVGLTAVFVGTLFIAVGGYFATKVAFNIFPASKDANDMQVTLTFAPGTDLAKAQDLTDSATTIVSNSLGEYFEYGSLYNSGNERSATLAVKLTPYKEREPRSPELVEQLQADLDSKLADGVQAKVVQIDAGPPAQPFTVVVVDDNREGSFALANDVAVFLEQLTVTRPDGTTAQVTSVAPPNPQQFVRTNGAERVPVSAEFDGSDTTRLFNLAEEALFEEFTPEKVATYGVDKDALQLDLGQEAENQESFATLGVAFPLVLLSIFILLAIQFRSLLQPLLIFLAIPFSFFGISLSLYITENPFSFFAMLGFFALIGLSIKNTILLTDYANQSRKAGNGSVDAISEALQERFRPLVATSATAVVAITPLAIISPFWQGLAVLIIFGLLSSTFLVLTVFPYYYLGAEFLRQGMTRKQGLLWLVLTVAIIVGGGFIFAGTAATLVTLLVVLGAFVSAIWYAARHYR